MGHLLVAAKHPSADYEPALLLATIYAEDGSSPACVGWLRRAYHRMPATLFKARVESAWFERVRYSSLFREMVRDLEIRSLGPTVTSTNAPADQDSGDTTGLPAHLSLQTMPAQLPTTEKTAAIRTDAPKEEDPIKAPSVLRPPAP